MNRKHLVRSFVESLVPNKSISSALVEGLQAILEAEAGQAKSAVLSAKLWDELRQSNSDVYKNFQTAMNSTSASGKANVFAIGKAISNDEGIVRDNAADNARGEIGQYIASKNGGNAQTFGSPQLAYEDFYDQSSKKWTRYVLLGTKVPEKILTNQSAPVPAQQSQQAPDEGQPYLGMARAVKQAYPAWSVFKPVKGIIRITDGTSAVGVDTRNKEVLPFDGKNWDRPVAFKTVPEAQTVVLGMIKKLVQQRATVQQQKKQQEAPVPSAPAPQQPTQPRPKSQAAIDYERTNAETRQRMQQAEEQTRQRMQRERDQMRQQLQMGR
jgi:hypothetical protein